ncbi:hypothetical protein Tco_0185164, partial [Tanacetum coccineum]
QSGKIKVINGSRVILSGIQRDNCVYSLDGHAMVLEKQGLFGKKSPGKLSFCENYVLGKSHRVSFGVGSHTTQGVIDYVHSDLWGPSQVESLGGRSCYGRRDEFSEEEQNLRVSRSSSWPKVGELQMDVQDKGED